MTSENTQDGVQDSNSKDSTKTKKKLSGITDNVSKSGMLLLVDQNTKELIQGNRIFLSFKICYKSVIIEVKGVATIKHAAISSTGLKLGVEFINIDEKKRKFFEDYALRNI
jgi:c-di-GMP-binding flagellar brake protein YcgR